MYLLPTAPTVSSWLDACGTASAGDWTKRSELHKSYKQWCQAEDADALKASDLAKALSRKGYRATQRNGYDVVLGLKVAYQAPAWG